MRRAATIAFVLVLANAVWLGWEAFRAADGAYREGLRAHRDRVHDQAKAMVRRIETAVREAAAEAEAATKGSSASAVYGYAKDGVWSGFVASPPRIEDEPTDRFVTLSLRGGEDFELRQRDFAGAVDAYGFFLQRIQDPSARAKLRWRMGRAALAGGDERLGRALLERALKDGDAAAGAWDGPLPVSILACLRLLDSYGDHATHTAALRREIELRGNELSTAALRRFMVKHFAQDATLAAIVRRRARIERAVVEHPQILREAEAVLTADVLLLARPAPRADPADPEAPDRTVTLEPVSLPSLEAGDLQVRIEYAWETSVRPTEIGVASQFRAAEPVRLAPEELALATLWVLDPSWESKMDKLAWQSLRQKLLVGTLLLITTAVGIALFVALARERRLAQLKTQLLTNVSHELKTPITSIRMFSEMLAEAPADLERAKRFGGLLRTESLRLSNLIENLLDFSRLGRKEVALPCEPVDLSAVARATAEGFALRAHEEGIAFEARIPEGSLTLSTNADAIERIALNLLDNALKYRTKREPWIRLSLEETATEARLSVSDNGIGIPAAERERVFEEFYRVRYEDYAVQGSGLGLSISRRLARKLGGDILLASEPGKGSTFTLVLPRSTETAA